MAHLGDMSPIMGATTKAEGHWWCSACKEAIIPERVTWQECHELCGHPVRWITFTKPEKEPMVSNALKLAFNRIMDVDPRDPVLAHLYEAIMFLTTGRR